VKHGRRAEAALLADAPNGFIIYELLWLRKNSALVTFCMELFSFLTYSVEYNRELYILRRAKTKD